MGDDLKYSRSQIGLASVQLPLSHMPLMRANDRVIIAPSTPVQRKALALDGLVRFTRLPGRGWWRKVKHE